MHSRCRRRIPISKKGHTVRGGDAQSKPAGFCPAPSDVVFYYRYDVSVRMCVLDMIAMRMCVLGMIAMRADKKYEYEYSIAFSEYPRFRFFDFSFFPFSHRHSAVVTAAPAARNLEISKYLPGTYASLGVGSRVVELDVEKYTHISNARKKKQPAPSTYSDAWYLVCTAQCVV